LTGLPKNKYFLILITSISSKFIKIFISSSFLKFFFLLFIIFCMFSEIFNFKMFSTNSLKFLQFSSLGNIIFLKSRLIIIYFSLFSIPEASNKLIIKVDFPFFFIKFLLKN
jgi:hypothetical protein